MQSFLVLIIYSLDNKMGVYTARMRRLVFAFVVGINKVKFSRDVLLCALFFFQYSKSVCKWCNFKASLYHTVGLASDNKHSKHSYNALLNFSRVSISFMQRYLVMTCTVSRALSSASKQFGTHTGIPMKYWYLSHACKSTVSTCMHIYVVA